MKRIKYEEETGVFIPDEEFLELQHKILAQRELIKALETEMRV